MRICFWKYIKLIHEEKVQSEIIEYKTFFHIFLLIAVGIFYPETLKL